MLIDLTDEDCTGKELEHNLDEVPHITANKNSVPREKRSPKKFVTSGVRVGIPRRHLTMRKINGRGMGPFVCAEMKIIADCIAARAARQDQPAPAVPRRRPRSPPAPGSVSENAARCVRRQLHARQRRAQPAPQTPPCGACRQGASGQMPREISARHELAKRLLLKAADRVGVGRKIPSDSAPAVPLRQHHARQCGCRGRLF